jgi:glucan phosphorylase
MPLHELDEAPVARGQEVQGEFLEEDIYAGYQDYFGFDDTFKYFLPDGKQYIEFRAMNEGQRAKYEKKTSRDIRFNRRTDDAAIKVDAAEDRHALIIESVIGWHMVRKNKAGKWEPVPFSVGTPGAEFEKWLQKANPQLVNDLYGAITRANPWMSAEMSVEMIDEEITKLEQLRTDAVERQAKEKDSANR